MRAGSFLIALLGWLVLPLGQVSAQWFVQTLPLPTYDNDRQALQAMVESWYQRFLNRPADRRLPDWVKHLELGTPPTMTLAVLLGGPEYFHRAGATPEGFVTQLHKDLVGRAPTADELRYWVHRVQETDRVDATYTFLRTIQTAPPPNPPNLPVPQPPFQPIGLLVWRELDCTVRLEANGIRIVRVAPRGLAALFGLKPEDVILTIDGQAVRTVEVANRALTLPPLGVPHQVLVFREGVKHLGQLRYVNNQLQVVLPLPAQAQGPALIEFGELGIRLRPEIARGMIVAFVSPTGPGSELGLQVGDRLLAINGQELKSVDQLRAFFNPVAVPRKRQRLDVLRGRELYRGYFTLVNNQVIIRDRLILLDDAE